MRIHGELKLRRRAIGRRAVAMTVVLILQGDGGWAGMATDGTVGPAQTITGPDFLVPAALGKQVGPNLFHSFQTFDLFSNESATFTGPDGIEHLLCRVTGGAPSTIDGRLHSAVGSTGFYFLNPAGVVFGPHAVVDVPSAFHVSTADELRLADGTVFSATHPQGNSLTLARPESFGFLGANPAGAILLDGPTLDFTNGSVLLAAGEVTLRNASLGNQGSEVRIVAQGHGPGAVAMDGTPTAPASGAILLDNSAIGANGMGGEGIALSGGEVSLRHSALTTISLGASGGREISIQGSELLLDGSFLSSASYAAGAGSDLALHATGGVTLSNDTLMYTSTVGAGQAGTMAIEAGGDIDLLSAILLTSTVGAGASGDITLASSGQVRVLPGEQGNGGQVKTQTYGNGKAGDVTVTAADLLVEGEISSTVKGFAEGHGGEVRLAATDTVTLQHGGQGVSPLVAADTAGSGDAGDLTVTATDIRISGGSMQTRALASGQGGDLSLEASRSIQLLSTADGEPSLVLADTEGIGSAGNLAIKTGDLLLEGSVVGSTSWEAEGGNSGDITIDASGSVRLLSNQTGQRSLVFADTAGSGNAGDIMVHAGEILLEGGAMTTATATSGAGGNLTLEAAGGVALQPDRHGHLANLYADAHGAGSAGNILIRARDIVVNGGAVSSSSWDNAGGNSGDLLLQASNRLDLLSLGPGERGSLFTSAGGSGEAGDITVQAGDILLEGGLVSSMAWESASHGGDILLEAAGGVQLQTSLAGDHSGIISSTEGAGDAGNIAIRGHDLLFNESNVTSHTWGSGRGGDILLEATAGVELLGRADATQLYGVIDANTHGSGQAGDITLRAGEFRLDGGWVSTSTFATGQGGNVLVATPAGSIQARGREFNGKVQGGIIAETFGPGNGGTVTLRSDELLLDRARVSSAAGKDASGEVGDLRVEAQHLQLTNNAKLSIANNGTGPSTLPHQLAVLAEDLVMTSGSAITTESSGQAPAGDVALHIDRLLEMRDARITTTANQGDGGDILITAPWLLRMQESLITTSVLGSSGNGGDISLTGEFLVLDGGFIQANTAAQGGRGGDITLQVERLLPMGGEVAIGGNERLSFAPGKNVIQAAAPTGVSGTIVITAPDLEVVSGLLALDSRYLDTSRLYQGACARAGAESSLLLGGVGGLPPSPAESALPPLHRERLERLLGEETPLAGDPTPDQARQPLTTWPGSANCRGGHL